MPVTAVIGGQFGSEGKGKIAAYLATDTAMAIRTGGPNAGHTVEHQGRFFKVQSIPCAFVNPDCILAIGAGGVIDYQLVLTEIESLNLNERRVVIDPLAVVISPEHAQSEADLKARISSTGKGVGAATIAKIWRGREATLARDVAGLRPFLGDVAGTANALISQQAHVLLEGTQGFGLSLHHGAYPFVTSRDTTAGALCSEAGISPRLLNEIVLVIRTYPIRVAGNSGPLANEITWTDVTRESGYADPVIEHTTVTGNVRRVGRFDLEQVKRAVLVNRPTQIAVNFLDYLDHRNRGVGVFDDLTDAAVRFVEMLSTELGVPVTMMGTGPRNREIIDRRSEMNPSRLGSGVQTLITFGPREGTHG